ncbi:hypothetical protein K488DRAFT_89493 [Vararia minispora EC-137]|uniref:Uncharacterized protein n=1 Tax=Vararia minispora EC-137 TaxID=1314806 RepID=A0ACB8QAG9_9AGAM|nr:hypothetical protein K488DRAFT_89493 [Vararia minispora EC-137]
MANGNVNDHYPLSQGGTEGDRLALQYIATKKAFGWAQPYPDSVDIANAHAILDLAAGSCVWILDIASHPLVRPRVRRPSSTDTDEEGIRLYACDLTAAKFPPQALFDKAGVQAFEHDVTKPFPEELYGKFDLIHMGLVVLALRPAEWAAALANVHTLLKPGGTFWSVDNDPVFHPPSESLESVERNGHGVPACMEGDTWIQKYNSVYTRTVMRNGTYYDLSFRLPDLLAQAGLTLTHARRCIGAFGRCGDIAPVLATEYAHTADNSDALHAVMANAAFARGELEAPAGHRITTVEEKEALAREMHVGVREEGAYIVLHEHVAVKN